MTLWSCNGEYAPRCGNNNTANGANALKNSYGNQNTASGAGALLANTTGNGNTASGQDALGHNTSGSFNTAIGFNAGSALTIGHDNVDIQTVGVAGESNTMRIGSVKQTSTFISGILWPRLRHPAVQSGHKQSFWLDPTNLLLLERSRRVAG